MSPTKFILWFLFIAIIPLGIATKISYDSSRKALVEEITNSLVAVAENKANQIKVFLYEKERNATRLSQMTDVVDAFEKFNQAFKAGGAYTPAYVEADNEYRSFFAYYQKSFDYSNLYLANYDGDVIFAVRGSRKTMSLYEMAIYQKSEIANVFVKAAKSSKLEISDFEIDPEEGGVLYIGAPIMKGSEVIGVLILQMNNEGVSRLVEDYTSLGETGEIILAARVNKEILFITPVRFDLNAAFKRRSDAGEGGGPEIQRAVSGNIGSGTGNDYRGAQVYTVRRFFSAFRWGMVVKMDTAEVIASADRLRWTLIKISSVLLSAVIILAVLIARSMSKPIKELTKTAGTIAGGDFSARAQVHAQDEIGTLARSFNAMTDKLIEAKAVVEQKKAELEEQHKLLAEANKELDSFTHTVSHDLQAPLRGVASFATFLEEDYKDKLDGEALEYIKEIREGTTRMGNLIRDLLTLSRISRIKNPFERADINDIVNEVLKRIEFDIKKHKVDMKVNRMMPTIVCDRIKLTEVFLNLINNAIKFSSKQDRQPVVEVGYEQEDECHKFFVKDNGIGIDPKYHEKIFGIFQRLHSQDEYEGSGAGLGIVRKVMDDHKGRVWVDSAVGQGTTFFFTIPKNLEISKVEPAEESSTPGEDQEAAKKNKDAGAIEN
jgi:signal transduction histidine kinase